MPFPLENRRALVTIRDDIGFTEDVLDVDQLPGELATKLAGGQTDATLTPYGDDPSSSYRAQLLPEEFTSYSVAEARATLTVAHSR